jgi:periplasmic glucans biosynthesis protein
MTDTRLPSRDHMHRPSRRAVLAGATSGLGIAALPWRVAAEDDGNRQAAAKPFSFDILTDIARTRAAAPFVEAPAPEGFLGDLSYDDYRLIRFDPDRARWQGEAARFHLHAFHTGWLFGAPVVLHEVVDGMAAPMRFSTADFIYSGDLASRVPVDADLPGEAGFRLLHPLNRPDLMDEAVAFLGASYFRALGQGNRYGLSARGLALDTAVSRPEEFPRFTEFWIDRPVPGADRVIVHALLDSPSVAGAYRMVVVPGRDTVIEVTARLFFRDGSKEVGLAPLTSMFLFSGVNRAEFDDHRPAVHDSEGLSIETREGVRLWRPLNNPPRLATSYFGEVSPLSFALEQRSRAFEDYHDIEARYDLRPSLRVEPMGDWGPGAIKLTEIPARLEAEDNIVVSWVPAETPRPGEMVEASWRLVWGMLPPGQDGRYAHVAATRAGAGGVSGVEAPDNKRKFVIDFRGGPLAMLPPSAAQAPEGGVPEVVPVVTASGGEVVFATLDAVPEAGVWRLVIDLRTEPGAVVEVLAHVAGYGRRLTEVWAGQWINA